MFSRSIDSLSSIAPLYEAYLPLVVSFINLSGVKETLGEIQFRKKLFTAASASKERHRFETMFPQDGKIICIYIALIKVGQQCAKIHTFQCIIILKLNYFMLKLTRNGSCSHIEKSGKNVQLHLLIFHVLESFNECFRNLFTFTSIFSCCRRLLFL